MAKNKAHKNGGEKHKLPMPASMGGDDMRYMVEDMVRRKMMNTPEYMNEVDAMHKKLQKAIS